MALTKVKAGNILLTTPSASSNDVTPATTQYVTTALANLADSAPSTLNTLNELAAALGDDANFSTTVTNSIATKLPLAGGTLTAPLNIDSNGGTDNYYLRFKESGADRFTMYENSNNVYLNGGPGNTHFRPRQNGGTGNFIITGGDVGIGETDPDRQLHIKDSTATGGRLKLENTSASYYAGTVMTANSKEFHIGVGGSSTAAGFANSLYFYDGTAGANRMTIASDGKVGIGTSIPSNSLSIKAPSGSNGGIDVFHSNGNKVAELVHSGSGDEGRLSLLDSGSTTVQFMGETGQNSYINSGKVGIGTTSPDTLLNLKDTGGIEVRLEADSNNNGQEDCFIRFYTDGKTQEGLAGMDNNNSSTLFSGNTENAMVFGTVSNLPVVLATNNKERMLIKANGGIQQQDPTSTSSRKEETFHYKNVGTSFTDFFSVDLPSAHTAVFYEIITFGGDWSGHSAARSYYKGFVSGTTSYSGDGEIENSGTYGSGSHIDWNYTRSGSTVTFQTKVYTGTAGLAAYIRIIGTFGNITLL